MENLYTELKDLFDQSKGNHQSAIDFALQLEESDPKYQDAVELAQIHYNYRFAIDNLLQQFKDV